MSGLLNSSINGSAPNLPENSARTFVSSFSSQSGSASPGFHHTGLHNIHGNFNVPNMSGTLGSRNSTMTNVPSSVIQQPSGSLSSGRFSSNNIPINLSQISHGSSHGHSGVTSRGGMNVVGSPGGYNNSANGGVSIPGILQTSTGIGNRSANITMLGNTGARITSPMGNIIGGGNIGRSMGSGGGLSVPGLSSRINISGNSSSGNLNVQGPNRLSMLQQASPQVISMLGGSYQSGGGPLSQSRIQGVNNLNTMGMLNDINSNDHSPFDINDFPQLTSRPSSAGGPQGQIGSLRKQGLGVSSVVQQNQEFSIQNEDFPALPGGKGGNVEYGMDLHQKGHLHDMQSQHFPMGRSVGFNLGGTYSSHRQQQQQQQTSSVSSSGLSFSGLNNQDLLQMHGSEMFPSSHSSYHSQNNGPPGLGLRPLNSPSTVSGMGSYDHIQQYQQHQSQNQNQNQNQDQDQNQFRLQQNTGVKNQSRDTPSDPYSLIGLLSVIRISDPDLSSLALGIDLTTLGLNLNSAENLYKTFGSPWSDEPAKGDPEFTVPQCYYAKPPPPLNQSYFAKFAVDVLFYIFYSMPKDQAQLYAAHELYNRGWFYHREHRLWFIRVPNMELLVKTNTYERGSYACFDPNSWDSIRKDNFVVHYDTVEKKPVLPQH